MSSYKEYKELTSRHAVVANLKERFKDVDVTDSVLQDFVEYCQWLAHTATMKYCGQPPNNEFKAQGFLFPLSETEERMIMLDRLKMTRREMAVFSGVTPHHYMQWMKGVRVSAVLQTKLKGYYLRICDPFLRDIGKYDEK